MNWSACLTLPYTSPGCTGPDPEECIVFAAELPRPGPLSAGDTTSVLLRFPARRTLAAQPAAVPELRRFALETARVWRMDEPVLEALSVIVSELVTNAVLHSGSPEVALLLGTRDRTLTVRVTDSGCWKQRLQPSSTRDDEALCGRGLSLVRAYAARITTDSDTTGTVMTAEIPLHTDRSAPWNEP
jgi:anti-sigma regulatory factor (Ser/Thr protein kinase)